MANQVERIKRFFRMSGCNATQGQTVGATGRRLLLQVSIDSGTRGQRMFSYVPDLYAASANCAQRYAERIEADYLCIHKAVLDVDDWHATWQRFVMFDECFDHYDQVLYIDSDVIIREEAPNIFVGKGLDRFWAVPVLSSDPKVEGSRRRSIEAQVAEIGLNIDRYFNTGVMLVGREMRQKIRALDWCSKIIEHPLKLNQPTINKIIKNHAELSVLDWRFNFLFVRENQAEELKKAYFVHFVGQGKKLYASESWRAQVQGFSGPNADFLTNGG